MATGKATVCLRGGFAPGTKVLLAERHGDFYLPGGPAVKSGTVDKAGEVSWSGLEPGQRFWVAEAEPDQDVVRPEARAVAITAKVPEPGRSSLSAADIRERLSQSRAPTPPQARIVEGSVGTKPTRTVTEGGMEFAHPGVGLPTPGGEVPQPRPWPRLEDNRDVDVRSATITGELHPVDENERPPYLGQHEIPADTEQASATPLGQATPIHPVVDRQEDAEKLEQESATGAGVAVPVSQASPAEQARAKDVGRPTREPVQRKRPAKKAARSQAAPKRKSASTRPKTSAAKKAAPKSNK